MRVSDKRESYIVDGRVRKIIGIITKADGMASLSETIGENGTKPKKTELN